MRRRLSCFIALGLICGGAQAQDIFLPEIPGFPGLSQLISMFFGGGNAKEVTQLANKAQLILSYVRQGKQLEEALKQTADMIKQGRAMPHQIYGAVMVDLFRLQQIVQGGRALAYSLGDLDRVYRNTFPGYQRVSGGRWFEEYANWAQASLDTSRGVLAAAGLQHQQMGGELNLLEGFKGQLEGAEGRMQALQIIGQINEHQVEQLMKLRQLMIADMSSKQAYQAAVIQEAAAVQATQQAFFDYTGHAPDPEGFTGK